MLPNFAERIGRAGFFLGSGAAADETAYGTAKRPAKSLGSERDTGIDAGFEMLDAGAAFFLGIANQVCARGHDSDGGSSKAEALAFGGDFFPRRSVGREHGEFHAVETPAADFR